MKKKPSEKHLIATVKRLKFFLKSFEWSVRGKGEDWSYHCPWCGSAQENGHKTICKAAKVCGWSKRKCNWWCKVKTPHRVCRRKSK